MRALSHCICLLPLLLLSACDPVKSDELDAAVDDADADVDASGALDSGGGGTPDAIACTPDTFLACTNAETARSCNATGNGFIDSACGAPGCNASAGRCNECAPSSIQCSDLVLEQCGADGLALPGVSCQHACVDEAGSVAAHCAHLDPKYLLGVCDTPASAPLFAVDGASANIDTNLDSNCNGGIVAQTGGAALCVMRYQTFRISAGRTLTVTGGRALAVVADETLLIQGTLDISAEGTASGPGGGSPISGGTAGTTAGGGGAGFAQAGGPGGSSAGNGGAANGGGTSDPLAVVRLVGGPRAGSPTGMQFGTNGGGGGGAATLIACRGTVSVSGTINAGGGGGRPGADTVFGGQLSFTSASGGGAGGYVVLQGLDVVVTGSLFANGGSGGGATTLNDSAGGAGFDGSLSATTPTQGGAAGGGGGAGGTGGIQGVAPGTGKTSTSSGAYGGGGGSVGHFQAMVPAGVGATLTPAAISPAFDPVLVVATK